MNSLKIDNILRYVVLGAIFLVPFIPFIVPGIMFFPFITGKAYAFRILVEIMVAAWAVLALRRPEFRPKFSWVTALATAFVVIIGLADIFGANPLKSIWSDFERMEGLVLMIHLLGFLFATSSVLKEEKDWLRLFNVSIVASVTTSFYGIFQLLNVFDTHQGSRLDATFGNSAYLAVYMIFHIFLILFFILRRREWDIKKWLYSLALVLNTIILYYTATRGAILGLIAGMFLTALIISIFEKENLVLKKVCIGGLVSIFVLIGGFFLVKNSEFVKSSPVLNRFATISLSEGTTKARFMVWNMAWNGFKEKPVLGWGQENFNYVFNKNYDTRMFEQEQWFDRTHNVFFDWLIAGGVLGLLSYLSLFAVIIFYLIKDKNSKLSVADKAVIIGMLAGYFVHNFFVFDNLMSYVMFFIILGYIHSLNAEDGGTHIEIEDDIKRIVIPVIIVASIFLFYFFNVKSFLTNISLINALKPHEEGIARNIEYYKKALAYDTAYNQEVREQLVQFAQSAFRADIGNEKKQEIFDLTVSELDKQIALDSNNTRTESITGVFYASAGVPEKALEHLNRALELSPNKQGIITLIGNVYLGNGQYGEALKYYKQAYDLTPQFRDLQVNYAVGAVYNKDFALAKELLGSEVVDSELLLQAYAKASRFEEVIKILELRIKDNPNDGQLHLSLAAAYSESGYRNKAIEEIKKVIEINPEFKEQGEYYIQQIQAGRKP